VVTKSISKQNLYHWSLRIINADPFVYLIFFFCLESKEHSFSRMISFSSLSLETTPHSPFAALLLVFVNSKLGCDTYKRHSDAQVRIRYSALDIINIVWWHTWFLEFVPIYTITMGHLFLGRIRELGHA